MKTIQKTIALFLTMVMLLSTAISGVTYAQSSTPGFSIYNGHLKHYYGKSDTNIIIPEGVEYIDEQVFESSQAKTIILPKSLKRIERWAFFGSQITSIVIPAGAMVGNAAFAACEQLKSVVISDGVQYINESAFSNCTQLTDVQLPDTLLRVGMDAFINTPWFDNNPNDFLIASGILFRYSNKTATSVTIPEGVKTIYARAFSERTNLKSIAIPPSVKEIQGAAFSNTGLVSVIIPSTVEKMKGGVFWRCKSLREVTLSPTVEVIGKNTFAECTSLKQITIPEGVTIIDSEAFRGCVALEQVNLPQSMKRLGSIFNNCESMRSLTIPAGVEWIDPKLIEVNTPNSWLQKNVFRLIGEKGSYAQSFAEKNGYEFVAIGTTPPVENGERLVYSGRLYKGAVMMDTRKYTMAPGNIYDIGVKLFGNASTKTRRVIPSSTSVASVKQLPNGNYRVTALRPGVTTITLYIIDPKDPSKRITHASIEFTVQNGVKQNGAAWRQMTYFN